MKMKPKSAQRRAPLYDRGYPRSGEPSHVDKALEFLQAAQRPLIAGGDGLFWSQAGAEIKEFVEITGIPIYTRRAGQGAVSEESPLAIRGSWKKPFTGRADVVMAIGFRFWSGEKFGQPPTWTDKAKYIQIDPVPTRIGWQVDADVPIVGDPKSVLRQMINRIKEIKLDFSKNRNSEWYKEIQTDSRALRCADRRREQEDRQQLPLHPARLCDDLIKVLDKNATTIIDSFTLSGWMSRQFTCRFMGQVVDAGPLAPVGHGVGMGIGAQLARPGQQVVVISGDGGLGIGGWDIETMARYKLPVIMVLWNNSSWGPNFDQMPGLKGKTDPFNMLPNIRYDKIFAEMGCYTEHVEAPDQITAALERAFKSGKPALVNVIGDVRVGNATLGGNLLGSTGSAT